MVTIRKANEIFNIDGKIENGGFHGRWHFSFDMYYDPAFVQFGTLRVFNDDTLSPGAVWPLHPHREIEVVTYCAQGEFRHADEHGEGGILRQGWVQHTTVGRGMFHSEINNRPNEPMRFIQMWFIPSQPRLEPAVQQKPVERAERGNRLLPLVSNDDTEALPIHSAAQVFSCFLESDHTVSFQPRSGWGCYLYLLEGGPVQINGHTAQALDAAIVRDEESIDLTATGSAELLLVHTSLA